MRSAFIHSLPSVLLVGGPDVDARLELMRCLRDSFDIGALGSEPALRDKFAAEGFSYRSYSLSRKVNPVRDVFTFGQLTLMFRRSQPQIVHTFDTKPGVWARLAARLAGVPIVIGTLPGLGYLYASDHLTIRALRQVYQRLQTLACKVSDLTIFQNHDDARQFTAAGVVSAKNSTVILGSGVSTAAFDPDLVSASERLQLRQELGIGADEIVVTMISRVIRSKGVLEFVSSAREVGAHHPNVRFLLVGPDDENSVDRLTPAELTQLKQSITWPGPRRDVPTVLAASDIFVLPSAYREGIPRVLLEAASMGLPIVTTDSPGCNEVVEDGVNGFLVPPYNSQALSKAIMSMIDKPELCQRFGQISRRRAVERFDLSVVVAQTRAVYQNLLERKAPVTTRLMSRNA